MKYNEIINGASAHRYGENRKEIIHDHNILSEIFAEYIDIVLGEADSDQVRNLKIQLANAKQNDAQKKYSQDVQNINSSGADMAKKAERSSKAAERLRKARQSAQKSLSNLRKKI